MSTLPLRKSSKSTMVTPNTPPRTESSPSQPSSQSPKNAFHPDITPTPAQLSKPADTIPSSSMNSSASSFHIKVCEKGCRTTAEIEDLLEGLAESLRRSSNPDTTATHEQLEEKTRVGSMIEIRLHKLEHNLVQMYSHLVDLGHGSERDDFGVGELTQCRAHDELSTKLNLARHTISQLQAENIMLECEHTKCSKDMRAMQARYTLEKSVSMSKIKELMGAQVSDGQRVGVLISDNNKLLENVSMLRAEKLELESRIGELEFVIHGRCCDSQHLEVKSTLLAEKGLTGTATDHRNREVRQKKLDELERKIEEMDMSVGMLGTRMPALVAQNEKLAATNKSMSESLASAKKDMNSLRSVVTFLESSSALQAQELSSQMQRADALEVKNQEICARNETLQSDKRALKNLVTTLEDLLTSMDDQINEQKSLNATLEGEKKQLQLELKELKGFVQYWGERNDKHALPNSEERGLAGANTEVPQKKRLIGEGERVLLEKFEEFTVKAGLRINELQGLLPQPEGSGEKSRDGSDGDERQSSRTGSKTDSLGGAEIENSELGSDVEQEMLDIEVDEPEMLLKKGERAV